MTAGRQRAVGAYGSPSFFPDRRFVADRELGRGTSEMHMAKLTCGRGDRSRLEAKNGGCAITETCLGAYLSR